MSLPTALVFFGDAGKVVLRQIQTSSLMSVDRVP